MKTSMPYTNRLDVVLVGAGIMSATLAVILKELDPSLKMEIYEVLGSAAQEIRMRGRNHSVLLDRPQRRSGESGTEDATHQVADLR